ncbi:MAG: WD40/YVTN/BNR-like repeat-containing protein, partial [Anaerolineae bacterium]
LVVGPDGKSLFAGTWGGGVFRSDDEGQSWQPVSEGLTSLGVEVLVVGPDGKSLFAGARGDGVFRSDDEGQSWQPVNEGLTNLYVQTLVVGPDGKSLFASTDGGGVFRSDDGGQSWRPVNEGLTNLNVLTLMVEPDGESLFAGTWGGGVFRSDDGGQSWQLVPDLTSSELPTSAAFGKVRIAASEGDIALTRPGMGWLPWATHRHQLPQAIAIHGNRATLYAPAGAAMILRAEVPMPLLWRAPTPYLALVAATWQGINLAGANAVPLSVGLGLAIVVTLLYVYAGVARPSQLRPVTVLWLLPRPRHLLAASSYQGYAQRWAAGDTLERLILLQAPTDAPFALLQLEAELRQLSAAFDAEGLLAALSALVQRGLLVRENGTWQLAEPLLAQLQRQEVSRKEPARLAEKTRQDHPLYTEARRFLTQARFTVPPADPFGLLCTSDLPLWADVSPLYVRLVLERPLDLEEFQAMCAAAQAAYGEDLRGHTAAVVIDRPPRAGDLYQIFALRAQRGLTIVPLPRSLMIQARMDRRELEALRQQMELYTGRTDLYDIRAAVTDVLSFFGRSGLLADLKRRLTSGRSAVVFGVRKVGKSSVLGRLKEECPWPVALVDLEGYTGGLRYVYEEALRGWRAALQAAFPNLPLPEWTDNCAALDPAAQAQAFRRAVVGLLDLLADQPGRPGLCLFLDEIDTLFDQPEYLEFAAVLRSVAEEPHCRGRFALLVAGLEPTLNRLDRLDSGRNPFYALFGEIPLWLLKPEDTHTMVVSIGGQMGISYRDDALDLLVEVGGGHPFLTRQLCSQAIRDLKRPGTVDVARASRAVEDYLRLARNYFAESLWGIDSGGPPPAEAALLRSLATTQPQLEENLVPPDLPPEERRARQLALDHLRNQSLVRRVENGWELTIPLYRRWIRRYILNLPDEAAEEYAR